MNKFYQFCSLAWTRAVVTKQQFVDFLLTASTYYGNWRFAKIDLRLLMMYRWNNPYRISRKFLQERGDVDLYTYGETPLTTMHLISKKAGIEKTDTVLELGSGRGRDCFWLHEWLGCKVIGIEQIPTFVDIANEVKDYFHVDGVTFIQGDYLSVDWGQPTVIYLYGSNLDDATVKLIGQKIQKLPNSVKVISVSFPIPGMTILRRFQLPFTWGDADVYVQHHQR